jgi:hypothetical protein
MLIIYRTNAGFEGKIAYIDRQITMPEFNAWQALNNEALACIEVDEKLMDSAAVADIFINRDAYSVAAGVPQKKGATLDLGYKPGDADKSLADLRGDAQVQALLSWTPAQAATWIAGKTTAQIFLMIFMTLQKIIKAARLMG